MEGKDVIAFLEKYLFGGTLEEGDTKLAHYIASLKYPAPPIHLWRDGQNETVALTQFGEFFYQNQKGI
jgi:hypothetical protein